MLAVLASAVKRLQGDRRTTFALPRECILHMNDFLIKTIFMIQLIGQ